MARFKDYRIEVARSVIRPYHLYDGDTNKFIASFKTREAAEARIKILRGERNAEADSAW